MAVTVEDQVLVEEMEATAAGGGGERRKKYVNRMDYCAFYNLGRRRGKNVPVAVLAPYSRWCSSMSCIPGSDSSSCKLLLTIVTILVKQFNL